MHALHPSLSYKSPPMYIHSFILWARLQMSTLSLMLMWLHNDPFLCASQLRNRDLHSLCTLWLGVQWMELFRPLAWPASTRGTYMRKMRGDIHSSLCLLSKKLALYYNPMQINRSPALPPLNISTKNNITEQLQ